MKAGKKIAKHLDRRQKSFDNMKDQRGCKRPGSQNLKKQL